MINISKETDVSQWHTMSTLASYVNDNRISLNNYIVDIGAADGKLNSNSYNLMLDNGWYGLLIEPNPRAFQDAVSLYMEYCHITEEKVYLLNGAVAMHNGKITLSMPENENDEQLASLVQNLPRKIEVDCFTVYDILSKKEPDRGIPGILSVDTEGYDYPVLRQWMDTDNRPQIIITESWPHLAYVNLEKTAMLRKNGYKKILHCGENEIFIKG